MRVDDFLRRTQAVVSSRRERDRQRDRERVGPRRDRERERGRDRDRERDKERGRYRRWSNEGVPVGLPEILFWLVLVWVLLPEYVGFYVNIEKMYKNWRLNSFGLLSAWSKHLQRSDITAHSCFCLSWCLTMNWCKLCKLSTLHFPQSPWCIFYSVMDIRMLGYFTVKSGVRICSYNRIFEQSHASVFFSQ